MAHSLAAIPGRRPLGSRSQRAGGRDGATRDRPRAHLDIRRHAHILRDHDGLPRHRQAHRPRTSGRLAPLVPMVQATDPGQSHNLRRGGGAGRDRPALRRVLGETETRTVLVMVVDVLSDQPNGVAPTEHDDAVEKLSPASADPSFGHRILPWTHERCAARLRPDRLEEADHSEAEGRVPIEDQVAGPFVKRERLAELLDNPRRGRSSAAPSPGPLDAAACTSTRSPRTRRSRASRVHRGPEARPTRCRGPCRG